MYRLILVSLGLMVASCSTSDATKKKVVEEKKEEIKVDISKYPKELIKVFDAHGGIQNWKNQKMLSYKRGSEKFMTDLQTRHDVLENDKFKMGFDGKEAWIKQDSAVFKGSPDFYHNLYFYFLAMPFVLSDDGIVYDTNVEPIQADGKTYKGVKISYNDGVGASSKDNYILFYDEDTYQMKYLAYTATFFSKETSDKYSLIKYEDWKNISGSTLPMKLTWLDFTDYKVGEPKGPATIFDEISLRKESPNKMLFLKP
ncbi:DUF6503 family protein [Aureivirga sp. CE67]|uniref:DUF6503 family protein n=1 Tax=Aureivirga sp. CE67 TaxID=1788983 RepID=UPI0018CB93FF|nr:DUF6503 family protein [Aureivirga sp. CE67]